MSCGALYNIQGGVLFYNVVKINSKDSYNICRNFLKKKCIASYKTNPSQLPLLTHYKCVVLSVSRPCPLPGVNLWEVVSSPKPIPALGWN